MLSLHHQIVAQMKNNIEMQNYKTGYFDNLVKSLLQSFEDEEELNIKDLHNMVIKRASKSYANIKLMENDKLWQKLVDKADNFIDNNPNIVDTETAFRHAMRCNKELILGIINRMLDSDMTDDDEDMTEIYDDSSESTEEITESNDNNQSMINKKSMVTNYLHGITK